MNIPSLRRSTASRVPVPAATISPHAAMNRSARGGSVQAGASQYRITRRLLCSEKRASASESPKGRSCRRAVFSVGDICVT